MLHKGGIAVGNDTASLDPRQNAATDRIFLPGPDGFSDVVTISLMTSREQGKPR
jgi:hypothetical protein